jgi:putative transcriptional regulator
LPFDAQLCGFDVAGVGVAILGVALIVLVLRMLLAQAVARDVRSRADAGRVGRGDLMPIAVDIDVMLARRKMSVGELADRVGITPANLAVLKNGRAKAVRFSTLAALCEELNWQPGDLLRWENANVPAG